MGDEYAVKGETLVKKIDYGALCSGVGLLVHKV